MKTNDIRNDIEQCQNDIIYFVKNILQLNLKPHEELLLKKLVEAKKTGKDLVFLPYRSQPTSNNDINNISYGTQAECIIIDEPNIK